LDNIGLVAVLENIIIGGVADEKMGSAATAEKHKKTDKYNRAARHVTLKRTRRTAAK
jgi:hypothetical protein